MRDEIRKQFAGLDSHTLYMDVANRMRHADWTWQDTEEGPTRASGERDMDEIKIGLSFMAKRDGVETARGLWDQYAAKDCAVPEFLQSQEQMQSLDEPEQTMGR